jgi:hypothetical protein
MEGIQKSYMDKYKEIMSDCNYEASRTLTSVLVWDLENFKHLILVAQSVPPPPPPPPTTTVTATTTVTNFCSKFQT